MRQGAQRWSMSDILACAVVYDADYDGEWPSGNGILRAHATHSSPARNRGTHMAHDTGSLASWAEVVPGAQPMTVDDLLALPDDGCWQYELVEGKLVRMPGSGGEASNIAA